MRRSRVERTQKRGVGTEKRLLKERFDVPLHRQNSDYACGQEGATCLDTVAVVMTLLHYV